MKITSIWLTLRRIPEKDISSWHLKSWHSCKQHVNETSNWTYVPAKVLWFLRLEDTSTTLGLIVLWSISIAFLCPHRPTSNMICSKLSLYPPFQSISRVAVRDICRLRFPAGPGGGDPRAGSPRPPRRRRRGQRARRRRHGRGEAQEQQLPPSARSRGTQVWVSCLLFKYSRNQI